MVAKLFEATAQMRITIPQESDMNAEQQIDRMAKTLAAGQTRRGMLRLLGGAALSGGLGLMGRSEVEAKRKKGKKGRRRGGGSSQPAPQPVPAQPTNQCQTNAQCGGRTPFCNLDGVCDQYPDLIKDNDYVAWAGTWSRRGTSNVYDVIWFHDDQQQVSQDVQTVVLEGNSFRSQGAGLCTYSGTLSDNGKGVDGLKECPSRGVRRHWYAYFE
jgi:hypothetical protein